jgi:CelD/BcsL family acetyltransferase involved in cellulose biosynthesis
MEHKARNVKNQKYFNFRRLDSFCHGQIRRVERKLRNTSVHIGKSGLKRILDAADISEKNLSVGLFIKERLVGYVLCIVDSDVINIIDVALLPPYRFQLKSLFLELDRQINAYGAGLPIEIITNDQIGQRLAKLRSLPKYFHYQFIACKQSGLQTILHWEMKHGMHHLAESPLPLPEAVCRCQINGDTLDLLHIRDPRQWLALREEWEQLQEISSDSTVFQSFDYLWLWWKYFGLEHDLCLLVFRNADTTIAVVPFMETVTKMMGCSIRSVSFISMPLHSNQPRCLAAGENAPYFHAALSYLFQDDQKWDLFDIAEQRKDNPLTDEIKERFVEKKWLVGELDDTNYHGCPYIVIRGKWEEFRNRLPRKLKKNLNRSKNILKRIGKISLETVHTWPELKEALGIYRNIERKSWKAAKYVGYGSDPSSLEFYQGLAKYYGSKGCFYVRLLKVDSAYIAGTFGILSNGVFYSLMTAFDQAYAQSSPGTLLEELELEECFRLNVREYDPLCGMLTQKVRWASSMRCAVDLVFYKRRFKPMLLHFMYFVCKPKLRRLLTEVHLMKHVRRLNKVIDLAFDRYTERFFPAPEVRRRDKRDNI